MAFFTKIKISPKIHTQGQNSLNTKAVLSKKNSAGVVDST
jgi:hypothetical protein